MALRNYERETIIGYNQEDKTATVYTHHPALIRKLDKLCENFPDRFKCNCHKDRLGVPCADYTIPKQYVTIRSPKILTDEQKTAARERMTRNLKPEPPKADN